MMISGFLYHSEENTPESWLKERFICGDPEINGMKFLPADFPALRARAAEARMKCRQLARTPNLDTNTNTNTYTNTNINTHTNTNTNTNTKRIRIRTRT
jgi:hypothetical protein